MAESTPKTVGDYGGYREMRTVDMIGSAALDRIQEELIGHPMQPDLFTDSEPDCLTSASPLVAAVTGEHFSQQTSSHFQPFAAFVIGTRGIRGLKDMSQDPHTLSGEDYGTKIEAYRANLAKVTGDPAIALINPNLNPTQVAKG